MVRLHPLFIALGLAESIGLACSDEGSFRMGALGEIEVAPAAIEFIIERVALGASEQQEVRVRNLGAAELRVEDARLEVEDALGQSPVELVLRAPPPLFVAAGGGSAQPLVLRYTRHDDVPRRLALVVQSTDATRRLVKVPVSVRRGVARLLALPAQAVFERGVTQPARQTLRLVNVGTAPLHLDRMALDAAAAPDFAARLAGQTVGGAAGAREVAFAAPAVVPAGGELALEVIFASAHTEPVQGELRLFGDSPDTEAGFPVPLFGNQSGPCILLRPGLVAFGDKAPGTISEIPVEVENCGAVSLEVTELALAVGSHAAEPALAAQGVEASSPRLSLVSEAVAPTATDPWVLEPAETREALVRYHAWTEAELDAGLGAAEDTGHLVVRSRSLVPTRAVPIRAATEQRSPTDVAGCEWDGGAVVKHQVELQMTADDAYEVWIDGAPLARDEGVWHQADTYALELDTGCHVLGIHAWDLHSVRSGLIALVKVDGVVRWTSGDAKPEWSVTGPDAPPVGWMDLFFDDGAWTDPRACSSTSVWGSAVGALERQGARWVWWNTDCNDLSNAYFRLTFTVD